MKKSLLILLVFLYTSIELILVNATCWDYPNPFRPLEKVPSLVCGLQTKKGRDNRVKVLTPNDVFQFKFTCDVQDRILCNKAEKEFKSAGVLIAKLINFNTSIRVNVTFGNFCKDFRTCDDNIIGKAITARTIPLQDDENVVRQYPQALAKQFYLDPEPQWGDYDINAYFNLHFDNPDFKSTVLHELIHGLEISSGWENYFSDQPVASNPGFLGLNSNQVTFTSLTSSFNILYVFIIVLIIFSYT
ncbi:hypothetical protein C1645_255230 [Glomus cerebriforme]|uniref:Lysine-specific metallo-endopeptidase domain-containing protein n=1 Tax=Glomus cerebriforme TaxID=658196 RepID=A0A397SR02_9GLOM|nr:hypothetical protein C1645_255230 [Glomus cerebriforme]